MSIACGGGEEKQQLVSSTIKRVGRASEECIILIKLPLYRIVESRVASGEWGGGLGAVAPAVGDEGPQHDDVDAVEEATDDEEVVMENEDAEEDVAAVDVEATSLTFVLPFVAAATTASPTTSISSSSSASVAPLK